MAASIVRGAACVTGKCLQCQNPIRQCIRNIRYYVLLPEIPKDTLESNPIMRTDEIPNFSKISSAKMVTGVSKLCMEFERDVEKLLISLADKPKTFENFLVPLEKLHYPPAVVTKTGQIMSFLNQTQDYSFAFRRVHNKFGMAFDLSRSFEGFYEAVKEVSENSSDLTEEQKAYVTAILKDCINDGATLTKPKEKSSLLEFYNFLSLFHTKFRENEAASRKLFNEVVLDPTYLKGMPQEFLQYTSLNRKSPGSGPWQWKLDPYIYNTVLNHCPSRRMRWTVWYANVNVSSTDHIEQNVSNHKIIEDIMLYRKGIAKVLGYQHYAQYRLENSMAGSVENLLPVIDELKDVVYPLAVDDYTSLQSFAKENGFMYTLDQWDIPYYRLRQRSTLYPLDDSIFSEYFTLQSVCTSYFNLFKHLFGVTVKENKDCDRVHPNVRVYEVYGEDGDHLGTMICDYFYRQTKLTGSWLEVGRERFDVLGIKPYIYLSFDFTPPQVDNEPVFLTLESASHVYLHFTHSMQVLMNRNKYNYQMKNMEGDSLNVLPFLMTLILMEPNYLKTLSCHFDTKQQLSDGQISSLIKRQQHMNAFDTLEELFKSAYDLELNMTHANWASIYERMWPLYRLTPFNHDDNIVTSDLGQFSGDSILTGSCRAYNELWSKMVAADMFEAFKEIGLENEEETKSLGRRLRDNFVEGAGVVSAKERFRRFRGRDPSLDALKKSFIHNPNGDS